MALRQTIARNTAFNAAGRVWEFVAGIVLIGFVVRTLGAETYGPWPLVAPFLGYVALLDFGISAGFAKYIAEHAARGDTKALSGTVSAGFFYYLLLGAIMVAIGWPIVGTIVDFAANREYITPEIAPDLTFLFRGGLILLAASNCVAPFTAVQTGLQRMGITNVFSAIASVVKIVSVVGLVLWGWGVRALLIGEALSTAVFAACSIVAAFRLYPELHVSPRGASWPAFMNLFGFGWRAQVARISDLIMFQTDKLIVLAYASLTGMAAPFAAVTRYELGVNLANKIRQGPNVLTSALLPAASHMHANESYGRIAAMYAQGTKFLAVAMAPIVVFAMATADLILLCWVGPGYSDSAWILRIIALGYVANVVPGAGVSIALGTGRPGIVMRAGMVSMGSNLIATLILVVLIGFWGIPIATALSMALSWAWFAYAMSRETGVGMWRITAQSLAMPFIATIPGAAIAYAAVYAGFRSEWFASFFLQLTWIAGLGIVYALSYFAMIAFLPFFTREDEELIQSATPIARVPGASRWLAWAARG